jgi:hypothetical protein
MTRDANYYSGKLLCVSELLDGCARVHGFDNRTDYWIVATFKFPWSDPIELDDHFNAVKQVVDDGSLKLTIEPGGPGRDVVARMTVRFCKDNA